MIKPLYKMCKDIPTQYCCPDACGRYIICKALRMYKMSEMVSAIFTSCNLLDMIDKLNDDDENWKNE